MAPEIPQLVRIFQESDVASRYLKPSKFLHTSLKPSRCIVTRIGLGDGFQAPVNIRLLLLERFGSLSRGLGMIVGGFGSTRESFLGFR